MSLPIWRESAAGRSEYYLAAGPRRSTTHRDTKMRSTGLMPDGETRFRDASGAPVLHYAREVSTFSQRSTHARSGRW